MPQTREDAGPHEGDVIRERYLLIRQRGEGGAGRVFEAWDQKLQRSVALKFPLRDDAESLARFAQEARCTSTVNHPNIVAVHDVSETVTGAPFLVMELLDGEDLADRCSGRRLPIGDVVRIARSALHALHEIHSQGVVHRDLKPENLFLHRDADGQEIVKLVDFGISITAQQSMRLTTTGTIVGTPHYIAPEHLRGEPVDARADLYAVGAILYECLTGCPPFDAATSAGVVASVLRDEYEPIEKLLPDCPSALVAVVDRALRRDPRERHASAAEMEQALANAVSESSTPGAFAAGVEVSGVHEVLAERRQARTVSVTATDNAIESSELAALQLLEPSRRRSVRRLAAFAVAISAVVLAAGWFVVDSTSEAETLTPTELATTLAAPAAHSPVVASVAARATEPNIEELDVQARAAYVRGDTESAANRYRAIVGANPDSASGWRGLGLSARANGDTHTARTALQHYLAISPDADDASTIREVLSAL